MTVGVFGRFWTILGTRGLYADQNIDWTIGTIELYNLVPVETSSGQNGPKTTKNSKRPAAPSILDPIAT